MPASFTENSHNSYISSLYNLQKTFVLYYQFTVHLRLFIALLFCKINNKYMLSKLDILFM